MARLFDFIDGAETAIESKQLAIEPRSAQFSSGQITVGQHCSQSSHPTIVLARVNQLWSEPRSVDRSARAQAEVSLCLQRVEPGRARIEGLLRFGNLLLVTIGVSVSQFALELPDRIL